MNLNDLENHKNYDEARKLITSYEITMCDGYRNDFSDDPQGDDDLRRELLIESLEDLLGISEELAEEFFDRHYAP
jgi:hypothetical protein